ncbi:Threonine aldolase [Gryganskiella cystojenkinii]|nr:Threonine aldolase [Gryganskiella cystojenkinii]
MSKTSRVTVNPLPYADFRSDTATAPTPEMFAEMMKSSLGDDVYNEDDSVKRLERYVADLCGHDAGLFCSSGTMTNQLALRVHLCDPPQSAMVDIRSHVFNYEAGGISFHSQAAVYPVMPSNGEFITAEDVAARLILDVDVHYAPTRVISLENTLNGTIMPLEEIARIRALALQHGIKLHLDGARLWHASITTGISMEEYCSYFDTVSLCLSKGIGAPIGSILVGSDRTIKKARHFRLLFGGGWRQAGFLAEAALWCIKTNWATMVETHRQARWLERAFQQVGCQITHPVDTNMIWVDTSDTGFTVEELIAELNKEGIKMSGSGFAARVVLHYQISDEVVHKFMDVLRRMAGTPKMKVMVDLTQTTMLENPNCIYDEDEDQRPISPQPQFSALATPAQPIVYVHQQSQPSSQPTSPQPSCSTTTKPSTPTPPQRSQNLKHDDTTSSASHDTESTLVAQKIIPPQRFDSLNSGSSNLLTRRIVHITTTESLNDSDEPSAGDDEDHLQFRRHSIIGFPSPRRLAFEALTRRTSINRDRPLSFIALADSAVPRSPSRENRRSMQLPANSSSIRLSRPLSAYGNIMFRKTSEADLMEERLADLDDEQIYWRAGGGGAVSRFQEHDARILRRSQSLNLGENGNDAAMPRISAHGHLDHEDLTDCDDDYGIGSSSSGLPSAATTTLSLPRLYHNLTTEPTRRQRVGAAQNSSGANTQSSINSKNGNKNNKTKSNNNASKSSPDLSLDHQQKNLQYRIAHNSASKAFKRASSKIVRWGSLLTREP